MTDEKEMPETITILGQKLKKIMPKGGGPYYPDDQGPYYETADVEEDPFIRAWPPDPLLPQTKWAAAIQLPSDDFPLVYGNTLKEVEVALTAGIEQYEARARKHMSSMHRLLHPLRTKGLERGPDTLVVNGITLTKYKTDPYGRCLEEKYRSCPLFVLERSIDSEYPATKLWRVVFETHEEDGWAGKWRATPEESLSVALNAAQGYVEDVEEDIEKLQERKKYFENLAVSLGFKE